MKKFLSVILALTLVLSLCPLGVFATDADVLYLGDSNLDTVVNIKDATLIQKALAKLVPLTDGQLKASDCDGDTKINIKDATWIQKYAASMECPYFIGQPIDSSDQIVPDTPSAVPSLPTDIPYDTAVPTVPTSSDSTDPTETVTNSASSDITDATEPVENTGGTVASTVADTSDAANDIDTEIVLPDDVFTTATVTDATETTAVSTATAVPETTAATETEPVDPPAKPDTNITIYFSNNVSWSPVNAYLYNDTTGAELKTWPGVAMTLETVNSYGEEIYSLDVDVTKYNRVVFNNGKSQTLNAAVTVASSGFFVTSQTPKTAMQLGIYAYGTDDYGTKATTTLKYPTGYNKNIEIWTPAGYDANDTSKKYSVIYLLDGQNQFDDADYYNGGWGSDEVITALMQNGGDGVILVGIDNSNNRDSELTPDIGDVIPSYASQGFENGTGIQFASFVTDTVVPYIEANYNVYTDAAHTAIVGSSSGGIEAFYIGIEHMDEFGMIGALSPAFMLFDKATWNEYFEKFDFASATKLPRIYFYNGGGDSLEVELLPSAEGMMSWLSDLGYPEDNMTFVYDEKSGHNEAAWRSIMPEVVSWLFELQ